MRGERGELIVIRRRATVEETIADLRAIVDAGVGVTPTGNLRGFQPVQGVVDGSLVRIDTATLGMTGRAPTLAWRAAQPVRFTGGVQPAPEGSQVVGTVSTPGEWVELVAGLIGLVVLVVVLFVTDGTAAAAIAVLGSAIFLAVAWATLGWRRRSATAANAVPFREFLRTALDAQRPWRDG